MGRIKPAWYYEKQAEEAQRREAFFRTRPAPTTPTQVRQRAATTVYYRSMLRQVANDPAVFQLEADTTALAAVGGVTPAGLLAAPPAGATPFRMRNSGVKPSRAHWYAGSATPTRATTQWGTQWTKYYSGTAGTRSHFSVPISDDGPEVTVQAVTANFNAIFKPAGVANTVLLGTRNGRCYLELETASTSIMT